MTRWRLWGIGVVLLALMGGVGLRWLTLSNTERSIETLPVSTIETATAETAIAESGAITPTKEAIAFRPTPTLTAPLLSVLPSADITGTLTFDTPYGKLWQMPVRTGTQPRPLFQFPLKSFAFQPAWSPDGQQVAYGFIAPPDADGAQQGALIWVANADGSDAHAVIDRKQFTSTEPLQPSSYRDPIWAADSQSIWVTLEYPRYDDAGDWVGVRHEVGRVWIATQRVEFVLPNANTPAPSPNGASIVYLRSSETSTRNSLWQASTTGKNETILVDESCFEAIFKPNFSPDGQTIAFAASGDLQCVHERSTESTNNNPITMWKKLVNLILPHIALAHGDFPPADVWLIDASGENLRRLTNVYEDYPSPTWSHDGRFIAFSGLNGIYLVEVTSGKIGRISTYMHDGQVDWASPLP